MSSNAPQITHSGEHRALVPRVVGRVLRAIARTAIGGRVERAEMQSDDFRLAELQGSISALAIEDFGTTTVKGDSASHINDDGSGTCVHTRGGHWSRPVPIGGIFEQHDISGSNSSRREDFVKVGYDDGNEGTEVTVHSDWQEYQGYEGNDTEVEWIRRGRPEVRTAVRVYPGDVYPNRDFEAGHTEYDHVSMSMTGNWASYHDPIVTDVGDGYHQRSDGISTTTYSDRELTFTSSMDSNGLLCEVETTDPGVIRKYKQYVSVFGGTEHGDSGADTRAQMRARTQIIGEMLYEADQQMGVVRTIQEQSQITTTL